MLPKKTGLQGTEAHAKTRTLLALWDLGDASEAHKLLDHFISKKGGEHVDMIEEQVRPLLTVHSVYQKCGKYDLTEDQVVNFTSQKQLTFDNPLLREILSAPSGQIDESIVEDIQLIQDLLNPSSMDYTDDSADLLSDLTN